MSSPLQIKDASEIKSRMIEHFISGIVTIQDEEHSTDVSNPTYNEDDPGSDTYILRCGLLDITNGLLVTIDRIYGILGGSLYEFIQNTDYVVYINTNKIIFSNAPDNMTIFKVTYKYNQQFSSKVTNVGSGTVTDMLLSVFALRIKEMSDAIEKVKAAAYIDSAQGDDLDQLVALANISRNPATSASGYVTVYRSGTGDNLTIPIGSIFSTDTTELKEGTVFESTKTVDILKGFASAKVPVIASIGYEGSNSNTAPNRIINVVQVSGVSRVDNPDKYIDYEFIPLITGKYEYYLGHIPDRTINSQVYPPAMGDKGLFSVMYWTDKSIDVVGAIWTLDLGTDAVVVVTEDTPENGITQIDITSMGTGNKPYIEIEFAGSDQIPRDDTDNLVQGYDQIYIYIRSSNDGQFSLRLEDDSTVFSIPNLFKFNDGVAATAIHTLENILTLYHGNHGLAGSPTNPIKKVRIVFESVGVLYVDWIGLGTFIAQVAPDALDEPDELSLSYTSAKLSLHNTVDTGDFFDTYDGDSSDYHSDQLMIYYQWKNNVSGGSNIETDILLRNRAKITFSSFGRGTKQTIRAALLDIDSIKEAVVNDYDDDVNISPGDIYVYIYAEGFLLSAALEATIIQTINDNRAAGIRASIFLPEIRYVNFSINLVYDNSGSDVVDETALRSIISTVIDDYFRDYIEINKKLEFANLISFIIREVSLVSSAFIVFDYNSPTEPTVSDDDIEGTYDDFQVEPTKFVLSSDSKILIGISTTATGVSIVVQRGNFPDTNIILTKHDV